MLVLAGGAQNLAAVDSVCIVGHPEFGPDYEREVSFRHVLKGVDDRSPRHTFVQRDGAKYRVQRSDSERLVCRYCQAVMRGIGRFQNDVAAHLMHAGVLPAPAKDIS